MDVLREMDAYCASCDLVRRHAVMADDPSSCFCAVCGTGQPLMEPVSVRRWTHRPKAIA